MNYAPPNVTLRPSSTLRLLLVDREQPARHALRRALEMRIARPMDIREAQDFSEATALLAQQGFDALVIDLATVGGPDRFGQLAKTAFDSLVYASGHPDAVGDAVAAVRHGAADFLEKPLDGAGFARRIERHFVNTAVAPSDFEGFVGVSPAIRSVFEQTLRLAGADAPVLITGEAGTGKNILAKAVHKRSRRRGGPFVRISCEGISIADLTAALSFGAEASVLDRAQGGTLFLDDVDGLDIHGQAALFRFFEGVEPGGNREQHNDVRLISAAASTAEEMVARGKLRPDLLFRLAVLPLHVPPLRERPEDIMVLAEHFLARMARARATRLKGFDAGARKRLMAHAWPGNARELEVVIQRLTLVHADTEAVTEDMVDGTLVVPSGPDTAEEAGNALAFTRTDGRVRPLWIEERRIIESAVTAFGGNIARAAAALEISPSTIYRKRQTWAELAAGMTPEQIARFA